MPRMTHAEYAAFEARRGKPPPQVRHEILDKLTGELDLHDRIIKHCNAQWPRWKYHHARPDQTSTIAKGACDFIVWASGQRVFLVEVKSATGKLSEDQRNWIHEMELLEWKICVVRSMEEFLEVVK